jgi:hypothetical protein
VDDEVRYPVWTSAEVARVMNAYRRAQHGAGKLRVGLIAAGVDPRALTVTPGISPSGEPVLHVTVLPVVAVHLSTLIAEEDTSGAPPRRPPSCRDDPDVA